MLLKTVDFPLLLDRFSVDTVDWMPGWTSHFSSSQIGSLLKPGSLGFLCDRGL